MRGRVREGGNTAPRPPSLSLTRGLAAFGAAIALAALVFLLFPGIDLWATGLFYRAGEGFYLSQWAPFRAVYHFVPYLTDGIVIAVPALFLLSLWRGRSLWRIDGRAAAYLLLALALGPGLLVNTVLKDHWGRARPAQVTEFGGTQRFTPAPLPADQCTRNCSFVAGHPAMGFYLVSLALLVPERRRRRWAIAGAVAAGAAVGVVRIAQGGHFLSDVVFAGLLVSLVSWTLWHLIVLGPARAAPPALLSSPERRRLALAALGVLGSALFSMAVLDRPIALFFHDRFPTLHAVFGFVTRFGLGKGYLIVSAVLFGGFLLASRLTADGVRAQRLARDAYRALFIFAVVAISGLAVDLLKPVFGRARPKLLFLDGFYGFSWGAMRSDYWSFPSGHSTTIAALATALALLWPRALPAWIAAALLVMASRIIIDAHYLSDVLVGAAFGVWVAWLLWVGFARAGLPLGEKGLSAAPAPHRSSDSP